MQIKVKKINAFGHKASAQQTGGWLKLHQDCKLLPVALSNRRKIVLEIP